MPNDEIDLLQRLTRVEDEIDCIKDEIRILEEHDAVLEGIREETEKDRKRIEEHRRELAEWAEMGSRFPDDGVNYSVKSWGGALVRKQHPLKWISLCRDDSERNPAQKCDKEQGPLNGEEEVI